jgi:UDP-glucose 4-epimerase
MKRRVLLLGGAGFIGSTLARRLFDGGHPLTVVDGILPHTGARLDLIEPLRDALRFVHSRVEEEEALPELCAGADVIIDSMGLTRHHFGMEHPLLDMELNLGCHLRVVEAMHLASFRGSLIYLGSKGQYGACPDDPIAESSPMRPKDAQGIHKWAAERHYENFAQSLGFGFVSLRLPNCFGPNQPVSGGDVGLVGSFIRKALRGETISVYETSTPRGRDLLYVPDLARLVGDVLDAGVARGAYNVSGYHLPIGDLARAVVGAVGRGGLAAEPMPEAVERVSVDAARMDLSRITELLGGPLRITPFDLALKATVEYFESRWNASGAAI